MYRSRRTRDLGAFFTFGGRVPSPVGVLLAAMAVASVATWILNDGARWAALLPARYTLFGGQVWRLVTYSLVQLRPLDLLFAGIAVYFFGPPLIWVWGERRFLGMSAIIAVGAALVTLLVAWLLDAQFLYVGIWPLVSGLIVMWSIRYPDQQVLLMFVVPVTGRVMGLITVGVSALMCLYEVATRGLGGLVEYAPLLSALGIAWVLAGGRVGLPRRWRLQWRDWWLERRLRRRSRHLHAVRKNGQGGPHQWMN